MAMIRAVASRDAPWGPGRFSQDPPTTRRKRIFHGYDCLLDCPGMGFLSLPDPQTMLSERLDGVVLVRAPAKVNLFLEVLAKRPDGYHEIATLMVAVSL